MSHALIVVLALLISAVAAATDVRNGRIPNKLTFPAMLIGLSLHSSIHGIAGLVASLLGLVICAGVPGILYKATQGVGIGGGDIKLFAALGAIMGPSAGLEVELSAFLLLGIYALFRQAYQGQLWRTLVTTLRVLTGMLVPRLRADPSDKTLVMTEMRMGPAIAVAVVTVLSLPYLMRWLPWLG
jgi:prepilin peptidase CpaA